MASNGGLSNSSSDKGGVRPERFRSPMRQPSFTMRDVGEGEGGGSGLGRRDSGLLKGRTRIRAVGGGLSEAGALISSLGPSVAELRPDDENVEDSATSTEAWMAAARKQSQEHIDRLRASSNAHRFVHGGAGDGPFAWVARKFEQEQTGDKPIGEAAAAVLCEVIQRSQCSTTTEIRTDLENASEILRSGHRMLKATCQLFINYVTRSCDFSDIERARTVLYNRGLNFLRQAQRSRGIIAALARDFIRDDMVILTHGYSRVVVDCLVSAYRSRKFSVVVTESRADSVGYRTAAALRAAGIESVTLVLDVAVAHIMARIDMILVGAESVVENGGCMSRVGTFQVAVLAKEMNKPFYVAVESFKFSRDFPLAQDDLPELAESNDGGAAVLPLDAQFKFPAGVDLLNPLTDYTPPQYITLLFSNLGVLTPSAVSDTLVQLYW